MKIEAFDIETLKLIRNKLDTISFVAKSHYQDHPELMDTIESLSKTAKMFANLKLQELTDQVETNGSQGGIVAAIGNSYSRMTEYQKQKEEHFPNWKL
ncbi:hypothetical protein [Bacillus sp. MRMR6]|uniref:hypothetical protein n=1 Tax=Bacillus sp. MRMR6 TaxID=1928617 RepID=UPI0009516719|nr:hypothetical protein [Bacillus sp. MRMR6]OLS39160.1 hypothetical protein BTR25_13605 [Bacillus sp. MRMR6]